MVYKEIYADLFKTDDSYALCQCISSDFGCGKGISLEFNKLYNIKNILLYNFGYNTSISELGYRCIYIHSDRKVFNLITKNRYWEKPTYKSLRLSLEEMRSKIINLGDINKIAMPIIGSDLDRLEWEKVSEIVKDVFKDLDIEILVCKLENKRYIRRV